MALSPRPEGSCNILHMKYGSADWLEGNVAAAFLDIYYEGCSRMPCRIRVLPGRNCEFYMYNRCLYEERLNPGWNREWRCQALAAWEEEYDHFLTQAETFQLEAATATRIWERRFAGIVQRGPVCGNFATANGVLGAGVAGQSVDSVIGCVNLHEGLCLQSLPECSGVCSKFQARRVEPRENDGRPRELR